MPLHKIESSFIQSLMLPDYDEALLLNELKPGERLTPDRQLDIYRRNLNGAHQKVLAQVYPACSRILGEDYFNQICRAYRFKYPSAHPDLNQYGEYFPAFLADHIAGNEALADFVYLEDLATLEWYWHAAYYCHDDQPFDFAGLQSLKEEQQQMVVLKLGASVSLQQTDYPVIAVWQANREETASGQEFEHDGSQIYYMIYRQQLAPQLEQLQLSDYAYLQAIQQGQTMSELTHHFGETFGLRLPDFIQSGWVSGYDLG